MSATFYPRAFQLSYTLKFAHTQTHDACARKLPFSLTAQQESSSVLLINEAGAAGVGERQEPRSRL